MRPCVPEREVQLECLGTGCRRRHAAERLSGPSIRLQVQKKRQRVTARAVQYWTTFEGQVHELSFRGISAGSFSTARRALGQPGGTHRTRERAARLPTLPCEGEPRDRCKRRER